MALLWICRAVEKEAFLSVCRIPFLLFAVSAILPLSLYVGEIGLAAWGGNKYEIAAFQNRIMGSYALSHVAPLAIQAAVGTFLISRVRGSAPLAAGISIFAFAGCAYDAYLTLIDRLAG
jgi:hypothetical protein